MKAAIIGGGLAGCALAFMLKQAAVTPVIYETGPRLAAKASGNALGLYNPRLSAEMSAQAQYYSDAFGLALEIFPKLGDVEWQQCGSLHLVTDEKRRARFEQAALSWGWGERMRMVSAAEASEVAGVAVAHEALYLPEAGVVSPEKLCAAYAEGAEVHLNTKIEVLDDIEADVVILACGMGVKKFTDIPVNGVRGQITYVTPSTASSALKTNLCYGGYFSPAVNSTHALGATFQRWLDHDKPLAEDDAENIAGLAKVVPYLAEGLKVTGNRAAIRTASKDHFPVVGEAGKKLYVSAGHGSHGILSSLMAAQIIAGMLTGKTQIVSQETYNALSPRRFEMVKPTA